MKGDHPDRDSSGSTGYGSSGKGKMWEEDQEYGISHLATYATRSNSSDLTERVQSMLSEVNTTNLVPSSDPLHGSAWSLSSRTSPLQYRTVGGEDGISRRNRESMAKSKDEDEKFSLATIVGGVVAGVALLGGIAFLVAGSSDSDSDTDKDKDKDKKKKKKTMVAPGSGGIHRMYRDDFEKDPKAYFLNLRK